MDIGHPDGVFGVDELALFDDDAAAGNGGLEAVDVKLFQIDIFLFHPMWEQQLHISGRNAFDGREVAHVAGVVFNQFVV